MSKRTYLSGSEKRKKLAAQKVNIARADEIRSSGIARTANISSRSAPACKQGQNPVWPPSARVKAAIIPRWKLPAQPACAQPIQRRQTSSPGPDHIKLDPMPPLPRRSRPIPAAKSPAYDTTAISAVRTQSEHSASVPPPAAPRNQPHENRYASSEVVKASRTQLTLPIPAAQSPAYETNAIPAVPTQSGSPASLRPPAIRLKQHKESRCPVIAVVKPRLRQPPLPVPMPQKPLPELAAQDEQSVKQQLGPETSQHQVPGVTDKPPLATLAPLLSAVEPPRSVPPCDQEMAPLQIAIIKPLTRQLIEPVALPPAKPVLPEPGKPTTSPAPPQVPEPVSLLIPAALQPPSRRRGFIWPQLYPPQPLSNADPAHHADQLRPAPPDMST